MYMLSLTSFQGLRATALIHIEDVALFNILD